MDVKYLIAQMTLDEKAGMCSGEDFWHTKEVKRLNIPKIQLSDGPHGLRKQGEASDHLGLNESRSAVCFPAGCTMASSFDRELVYELGSVLGNECQAEDIAVLLGPAVNIKRSPLCGRNFEYYSEDPYVTSEIAAAQIAGIQSQNVGACVKHFFANNQEYRRMTSSSQMDERTAREIYLAAFEGVVKQAKPWAVMTSYNRINRVYAGESRKYLTDLLRNEWGFDGFTVSDWGAVNDRQAALEAGMDLEMPACGGVTDRQLKEAVEDGTLDETCLDQAAEHILTILNRYSEGRKTAAIFNKERDHAFARRAAEESIVLLKNEQVLPIKEEETVALIGVFAAAPRYQGGGSSHIHASRVESALEEVGNRRVVYVPGYRLEDESIDQKLMVSAVEAAKRADKAIVFAGVPDSFESEGYDRTHMRLPGNQNELIRQVAKANPNTIVVLHNGSPVEMPWVHEVKGILEAYLGGQAVGGAVMSVLWGEVNPSGHLAETFPERLEDTPSYLWYQGEGDTVEYREGVFVGYRWYDSRKMKVLFPFGHGLSYTSFAYSNLRTDKESVTDQETLKIMLDVTNTGSRTGKEVVQLYIAPKFKKIIRPVHELKGFEKIELVAGETKTVEFSLDKRAFAHFDMEQETWMVEDTDYTIEIGSSSRDIRLRKTIHVAPTHAARLNITMNTTIGDIVESGVPEKALEELMNTFFAAFGKDKKSAKDSKMLGAMLKTLPLRGLISFSGGRETPEHLMQLADDLNHAIEKFQNSKR